MALGVPRRSKTRIAAPAVAALKSKMEAARKPGRAILAGLADRRLAADM